jgi:predicted kinase
MYSYKCSFGKPYVGYNYTNYCLSNTLNNDQITFKSSGGNNSDTFNKQPQECLGVFSKEFDTTPDMPEYNILPSMVVQNLPSNLLISIVENHPCSISEEDYKELIKKETILTKYDTPEILLKRKNKAEIGNQQVDSGLQEQFAEQYIKDASKYGADKRMLIVMGLPGAGKTTYIENSSIKNDYYVADIDNYREDLFMHYNAGKSDNPDRTFNTQPYHNAARQVFQELTLTKILNNGNNVAIPTTGIFEYAKRLAKAGRGNGYKVSLLYLDTPVDIAIRQGLQRAKKTNDFFDPLFVYKRYYQQKDLLEDAKNSKLFDKLERQVYTPLMSV